MEVNGYNKERIAFVAVWVMLLVFSLIIVEIFPKSDFIEKYLSNPLKIASIVILCVYIILGNPTVKIISFKEADSKSYSRLKSRHEKFQWKKFWKE